MKVYTFIGGHLFPRMALTIISPPMLVLGRLDIHDDHIAGDCTTVSVDTDNPPVFNDPARRIFSEASYIAEMQEKNIVFSLQRDRGFPDDKVLVHIRTCGPNKKIFGRWDTVSGNPFCLAKGFGVDGPPLLTCPRFGKHKPVRIYYAGKWNEGLVVFSPGDAVAIVPQRPDGRTYMLDYDERHKL
jgi:hypothetical protein